MATVKVFPPRAEWGPPPLYETVLPQLQEIPSGNLLYLSTYSLVVEAEKAAVIRYCEAQLRRSGIQPAATFSPPAKEVASAKGNADIYALGKMYLELLVPAAYLLLAIAPLVNGLVAAAAPLLGPVAEPTPPVSPSAPFQALPPSVLVGCDVMYGLSGVVL
ncbi:hypothetical protein B0H15DRAFT_1025338 [Mycena belliarum]|uniref:Uncharacterized protein n=1 Tax=Mycena belliarum TaxID=1033014 RepID=A0AAD6TVU4_9AGAR|nr:hypothetical protein B0H15DRAFT_1025338 [Mycena belliae]